MNALQDLVVSVVKKIVTPNLIMTLLVRRLLKKQGVILDDKQFDLLKSKIKRFENLTNTEEDSQDLLTEILQNIGVDTNVAKNVNADLEAIDANEIEAFGKECITKAVEIGYESTLSRTFENSVKHLSKQFQPILNIAQKDREEFNNGLILIWGDAIKQLEFFITTVRETCERQHKAYKGKAKDPVTFNAIGRLSARACQIAFEILALLKSGFPDGAYARWRTLHEVTVTALFITKYGEDTAKRFLHHYVVDSYDAALLHQKNCEKMGYEPIAADELEHLNEDYNKAVIEYGDSFKGQYGWAAEALSLKKPTYKDIEESVGLSHLRPYYKYASSNVHSTPTGIYNKISLPESGFQSGLLTGPSVLGLDEPGRATVVSLNQIAIAYISLYPNIDSVHICNLLNHCKEKATAAFIDASEKIVIDPSIISGEY